MKYQSVVPTVDRYLVDKTRRMAMDDRADLGTSNNPIGVLVVDDSALMRQVMTDIVGNEADMEVMATASGGREAVRMAADLQPDIVLMDIHMPDLDGIQATWLVASRVPRGA